MTVPTGVTEEPAHKRAKFDIPETLGEEAVTFSISFPDLRNEGYVQEFRPEMTHQLLGEEELIKGYTRPKLTVHLNLNTFKTFLEFSYESRHTDATDVMNLMKDALVLGNEGTLEATAEQSKQSVSEQGSLWGEPLQVLRIANDKGIRLFHSKLNEAKEALKTIHARAQQYLPFFIDGATAIDHSEPEWELIAAIKTIAGVECLVGFCTVYRFFAWPDRSRLRVSQILVLPPFQKQGIGRALLDGVYALADSENLQDVIYEDPTDEVEVIREKIELQRASESLWLTELAAQRHQASHAMNGHAGEQLPSTLALTPGDVARAQKELRISKQQVRKVWEALLVKQQVFQKEPGSFALRGLVARRLVGKFTDTEQQAVGKQIFAVSSPHGEGFCMHKVPKSAGLKGMPVALEDKKEKGQSKEEREEALEDAVEARWEALNRLVGIVA